MLEPIHRVYAVADGGDDEIASTIACRVLREAISDSAAMAAVEAYRQVPDDAGAHGVTRSLTHALARAAEEIYQASRAFSGSAAGPLGTGLDAALIVGSTAFTAHIGPGRICLWRGGQVHRLTGESVEGNRPGQLLGHEPSASVDTLTVDLVAGDHLILCSRGLGSALDRGLLPDPMAPDLARALVHLADPSENSVTAVVISLASPGEGRRRPAKSGLNRVPALRRCGLFSTCTYRELAALAEICDERSFSAGNALFHTGTQGETCFLVVEGTVDLRLGGRSLCRRGPGELFGELVLLDEPARSASAYALTPLQVLAFSRHRFEQLLRADELLANKVLWRLAVHLATVVRACNHRLRDELGGIDTIDVLLPSAEFFAP